MCAGLIGHRALAMTGDAQTVGVYDFGAVAHIVTQVAFYQKKKIFALTKPGDAQGQNFAKSLGAVWVGDSGQSTPQLLDAAVIFAPPGSSRQPCASLRTSG